MQRSVHTAISPVRYTTEGTDARGTLRELFELLQDYAPIWYTEELHNRIAAALGEPLFEPALS